MAFKNTNLSLLAYNTGYILRRNALISRILSQSSGTRFTPGNGYTYEIFTQPGQFTAHTGGFIDVMLVAAGGGGGSGGTGTVARGGGGGAGGMLTQYNTLFSQGIYTVTIGGGGAGGAFTPYPANPTSNFNRGQNGQNTQISSPTISTITATGGGGGGVGYSPFTLSVPQYNGQPGGSGGGAGGGDTTFDDFGTGISGQGYPGGLGKPSVGPSIYSGGGGGGAAQTGFSFPTGHGGSGASAFGDDTGIPPFYGTVGPTPSRYFAGGGSGGFTPSLPNYIVGGGGVVQPPSPQLQSGLINSGGGGAGGNPSGNPSGNAGAPGIVIVRYLTSL